MKYYFCTVKELTGECEHKHNFLLKTQLGDEYISGEFKSICCGWFSGEGNPSSPDSTGLIWSEDGRAIDFGKSYFKEIPQSDFDVLQHYVTEL